MEKLPRLAMTLPKWIIILSGIFAITSCNTIHPKLPVAAAESEHVLDDAIEMNKGREHSNYAMKEMPYSVKNALLPSYASYVKPERTTAEKFDVSANNLPAKEFFMGLVSDTNQNMLVNRNVTGTVSIELKNVSLRQTLEAVKDMYGYDYRRTSYGYEVFQPQITTRLYYINYLNVQRTGHSYTQLTSGQVSNKVGSSSVGGTSSNGTSNGDMPGASQQSSDTSNISSIETKSEMTFWKDIEKAIATMVANDSAHNVNVNSQTGVISVRAFPSEQKSIERYVNSLQSSLNRQVILEAKILEVQLDDTYMAGIDWSILNNPTLIDPKTNLLSKMAGIGQGDTNIPFQDTTASTFNGMFAVKVNGNFKTLISLLQNQGNVQVLSSPHISTVNNQKAVIKVGSDEFFVTGVSTTNSVVGNNTLPSQDVTLTPFFSGITLDVTPEISSEDTVVLHIHPSISKVIQQDKSIGLGSTSAGTDNTLNLPLALSTIRESDNIVRAKNGQIIIIGGLMTNNTKEENISTPGLSRIPFIGSFFRRIRQDSTKSELVILLRPIVATNTNFTTGLENEKRQFSILRRPFHAGGLPHVFGNEAERNPD